MRHVNHVTAAFAFISLLACGSSTGPAAARNDPGTGTLTLHVDAEVAGIEVGGTMTTGYLVAVRNAQALPVSGATVTVRNSMLGSVTLSETAAGSGVYGATRPVFPSTDFTLDVVRAGDNVRGVVLGNPGAHVITAPAQNSTVAAGQPLTVTWSRPSQALLSEIETRDFGTREIPDNGTYTIPGADNPARTDQRIRLNRFNQIDIAGGLPGSRMRVEVRRTIEPVIAQ
ncbi:MAG: hypothetical protein ACT4PJ_13765 [Gemmatimonadaceae bacterium]